jgi:hypothetical protein
MNPIRRQPRPDREIDVTARRISHSPTVGSTVGSTVGVVDIATWTASQHLRNYTAYRSRTIYRSPSIPDWVELDSRDDSDAASRSGGFRSGVLGAKQKLTAQRHPDRRRTGILRAMTDNVAAIHLWRSR